MAINSKNYVDISTQFPIADASMRSFGGLVFTGASPAEGMLDSFGRPIPKDENGAAYPSTATESGITYYRDAAKTEPWTWANGNYAYYDAETKETSYPANHEDIILLYAYEDGDVISLSASEAAVFFGKTEQGVDTPEAKFANNYYAYSSPSGRFASSLLFAKVKSGETPKDAFMRVDGKTNMFGSFTFLSGASSQDSDAADGDTSIDLLQEVALYNQSLDTKYLFVVCCTRGDSAPSVIAEECQNVFGNIKGVCYISADSPVSAYMPMAIFASTDYENGTVVNFMFKQFGGEEPTVTEDRTYKTFNAAYVNFYGRTQSNGQTLDFYQRGFNTDGTDTAIYCNEVWFKAACETSLITYLVGEERIPANDTGVNIVEGLVRQQCVVAANNGTFLPKQASLASEKGVKEFFGRLDLPIEVANNTLTEVASSGYSVYAYLSRDSQSGIDEYVIVYYVFYGTADSVRFIKGNNVLLK